MRSIKDMLETKWELALSVRKTTIEVCLTLITMGGFPLNRVLSTASLENTMSRMHSISLPVALFCSALAI